MVIFIIVAIVFIPLLINVLFKYDFNIFWLESEWSAGDALNFYAGVLSFLGTVILGIVSIWQTKKANRISEQLLKKDMLESTDFIQLQNKIEVIYKRNNDSKITWPAHHKRDYGANLLIERCSEIIKVSKYNEYLIKLFFSNSSERNHIRKIELENFTCIQDSDKGGLYWDDNSNSPIPIGFDIDLIKDVYLNWISNNEFYIQFRLYCVPNKIFDSVMNNGIDLCFIFQLNVYSFSGVKTEMIYKLWISNDKKDNYIVMNSNSTIQDTRVI